MGTWGFAQMVLVIYPGSLAVSGVGHYLQCEQLTSCLFGPSCLVSRTKFMVSFFGQRAVSHISLWQRKQIEFLLLDGEFPSGGIVCPVYISFWPQSEHRA